MRPSDAKQVLRRLFAAYRTTATDETVAAYADALLDLDLDVALEAVAALIRSDHELPSIARIRDVYRVEHRRISARAVMPRSRPRGWQEVQLTGVRAARAALARTPASPSLTDDLESA